jgi:biotin operon repressor
MSRACGHIHAGSLHTPRLRLVLDFLSDGRPHSTRDIVRATGSLAINAVISELRHHGADILHHRQAAPVGKAVWSYYTMTKAPKT